jgi:hypothetical protein
MLAATRGASAAAPSRTACAVAFPAETQTPPYLRNSSDSVSPIETAVRGASAAHPSRVAWPNDFTPASAVFATSVAHPSRPATSADSAASLNASPDFWPFCAYSRRTISALRSLLLASAGRPRNSLPPLPSSCDARMPRPMTDAASIARENADPSVVPAPSTAAIASALMDPSATPVPNVSPDSMPAARMTGRILAAIGCHTGARNSAIFDPAALAAP